MLKVKREGILLRPTKIAFEDLATLNPGVYQDGDYVHVLYRAVNKRNVSSIGYAKLKGPMEIIERWEKPIFKPQYDYEKRGLEDPRITKFGNELLMTYVAHDGKNAQIAYMRGKDVFDLKRGGIISPQITYKRAAKLMSFSKIKDDYFWFSSYYEKYAGKNVLIWEKDGVFFPEKIRGKFALLHRILPDIQQARVENLEMYKDAEYWHNHLHHIGQHVVLEKTFGWEERHVGAGAPPIKTKYGWLLIYHGAAERNKGRIYNAGAALLDLKDPKKVLARLPYPILRPDEEYEHHGQVSNVVFPTGTAIFHGRLFIYYGAADTYIAVASVGFNALLKELLKYKVKKVRAKKNN
jgi:beta-1,2-mannobiose phosphorylase / 1,2-beta-oligomannan phosphorylase